MFRGEYNDEEEPQEQQLESGLVITPTEEDLTEDSEEILKKEAEKANRRRYIWLGIGSLVLIAVVLVVLYKTSSGNTVKEPDPVTTARHPIVELAKIKNVPLQSYNASAQMIANTPRELLQGLPPKQWSTEKEQISEGGTLRTYGYNEEPRKVVTVWLKIYPNGQVGRKELYQTFEKEKDNINSIVSETSEVGNGGFIVNDNQTIAYWFYYEPNLVAKVEMYQDYEGTLQETKEWAYRTNYSIYKVVGR